MEPAITSDTNLSKMRDTSVDASVDADTTQATGKEGRAEVKAPSAVPSPDTFPREMIAHDCKGVSR